MTRAFFDSNVLLYATRHDPAKADIAQERLGSGGVVSVQVLNEIMHVSRRKFRYSWDQATTFVQAIWGLVSVVPLTLDLHDRGVSVARRHQLSVYDGQIVAAALIADCDILYSEDMHHGLVVDGRLRIENPFAQAAR